MFAKFQILSPQRKSTWQKQTSCRSPPTVFAFQLKLNEVLLHVELRVFPFKQVTRAWGLVHL
jgi:hypothetical protein